MPKTKKSLERSSKDDDSASTIDRRETENGRRPKPLSPLFDLR
jgi:hypothetical protein